MSEIKEEDEPWYEFSGADPMSVLRRLWASLPINNYSKATDIKTIKRSLPKPPVPPLDHTLDRYLEYAAVVAAAQAKSLHATHAAVERFRVDGARFQRKLEQLAEKNTNWINGFWLPEMYLRVRLPLPVNSSPAYIFPQKQFKNDEERLRYTALLMQGILEFKDNIDRRKINREVSTGKQKVHMCMEQYDRILGCYREPGLTEDVQIRREKGHRGNEHVIVMCRDQVFVVYTRWAGQLLPLADLVHQLKEVVRRATARGASVIPVGAAAVGDRTVAAEFWKEMNEVEANVKSLAWARSALFTVCLDDVTVNGKGAPGLAERGKYLLTGGGSRGNGLNRWYDSTIQLIVSSDGTSGLCIEHSTAEGIVIINMAEDALRHVEKNQKRKMICVEERQFSAKPLTWHVSSTARALLEKQKNTLDELASELELEVLEFKDFGKALMKKCGVSPDGFVQLAMQLAHYRTHGYLVSTYESASLRRFSAGRVDNIRANTQEALAWVTSMGQNCADKTTRLQLFRTAAEKQAKVTAENISGLGIDNHLCALSVIAREEGGPEPALFRDPLWNDLMRFPLSTSQVTTSASIKDTYLCYGAVVRDGYGCAYNLQDDSVIFAPSAFRSNPRSDLLRFTQALAEAMRDMRILLGQ